MGEKQEQGLSRNTGGCGGRNRERRCSQCLLDQVRDKEAGYGKSERTSRAGTTTTNEETVDVGGSAGGGSSWKIAGKGRGQGEMRCKGSKGDQLRKTVGVNRDEQRLVLIGTSNGREDGEGDEARNKEGAYGEGESTVAAAAGRWREKARTRRNEV